MPCPRCGHAIALLDLPGVCRALKVSGPTVYKLIHAGELPPPTKLGAASRWFPEDIHAFIQRRRAAVRRLSPPPACTQATKVKVPA